MKLVSWNPAGRSRSAAKQVEALAEYVPDVVAFQEVTAQSAPILRTHLSRFDLPHIVDGFDAISTDVRPRKYRQLVASRFEVRPLPCPPIQPWPEALLPVEIASPCGGIELFNCHVPPGSSNGWIKPETFESIYALLSQPAEVPRILCGDFNTPQEERPDGTVITWGQRIRSDGRVVIKRNIRGQPGARWDAAERSVLTGLKQHDLACVFRDLHGYQVVDFSWRLYRKGKTVDRRFDHVFASAALCPTSCRYLHGLRKAGLSDHSAIEVVFRPGSSGPTV